ncbi:hypothetical protein GCM10023224_41370 [Streptomonospora halophila]|uniref:CopG family transcriptional regulator n=1 Tax=Streptomonospora halophila TaxID=427369 RepID=A0ABP9GT82_9ACTN
MANTCTRSTEPEEHSAAEARDRFADRVDRATCGDEATYVTRGREHGRTAAIAPAWLVDEYEALLDKRDARIARERLADIRAGRGR